jgi:hypothetical protein
MNLFDDLIDKTKNWLPYDGTVQYYGQVFPVQEANFYYQNLLETISWRNDEAIIFGKKITTKRKVASSTVGISTGRQMYSRSSKGALYQEQAETTCHTCRTWLSLYRQC